MGAEENQAGRRFEPPPWEREAFEALAAKRAQQEAEARAFEEALKAAEAHEQEAVAGPDVTSENGAPVPKARGLLGPEMLQEAAPAPAVGPDSKFVQAMMLQLQREERTDRRSELIVAWVAAGMTMVLGASMLIGGLVIARESGGTSAAVIGSAVLSVFGLVFMGMAAWVWVSATRRKGR